MLDQLRLQQYTTVKVSSKLPPLNVPRCANHTLMQAVALPVHKGRIFLPCSWSAQVEFVYDYYLQLYGVREVAERELHSLFSGVRQYATRHPRVRVFALFCGIPMTLTLSTVHG